MENIEQQKHNENGASAENKVDEKQTIAEYNFSDFKFEKFLNNNTGRKTITILGSFPSISDSDKAVLILEKKSFSTEHFESKTNVEFKKNENGDHANENVIDLRKENNKSKFFTEGTTNFSTEFINNIYGSFTFFPDPTLNGVKVTAIYPATEKHIEKYSARRRYLIKETPVLYKNVTEPYIEASKFSLEWVYNILEHKQEVDRIIYEDENQETGFILVPDLKWDGSKETLYMLAIPHTRGIKSLRDLNETHLPLLKNIRDAGCKAIKDKYDLDEIQLRIYIHYQPSFYHLHVHFTPVSSDTPGIYCEKSHLIDTVINNIELLPDYYQKSTLLFVGYEGNELLNKMLKEINPEIAEIDPLQPDEDGNQRKKLKLSEEND